MAGAPFFPSLLPGCDNWSYRSHLEARATSMKTKANVLLMAEQEGKEPRS
jgi:hypothetical protein